LIGVVNTDDEVSASGAVGIGVDHDGARWGELPFGAAFHRSMVRLPAEQVRVPSDAELVVADVQDGGDDGDAHRRPPVLYRR